MCVLSSTSTSFRTLVVHTPTPLDQKERNHPVKLSRRAKEAAGGHLSHSCVCVFVSAFILFFSFPHSPRPRQLGRGRHVPMPVTSSTVLVDFTTARFCTIERFTFDQHASGKLRKGRDISLSFPHSRKPHSIRVSLACS